MVPMPPAGPRDSAEPLGGEAGFELADFVGGADEDHIDSADAAAHLVGRAELDEGVADDHADHVAGADEDQGGHRKAKLRDRPKTMVNAPKPATHQSMAAPARRRSG